MVMPTFLIIGAPKGGTSTLHYALVEHPEVFMCPMKEPSFFWAYGREIKLQGPGAEVMKHRYVADLESYQALFNGVTTEKAIGESSVRYFSYPLAPELIHQFIPEARLIVILRQPAERAFSAYMHYLRDGMEPCPDFSEALRQEREGLRDHWTFGRYLEDGFYFKALQRYYEFFDPQQFHISLVEDLKENPSGLLRSIYRHINVDDTFEPDMSHRHNVSGIVRNPLLRFLWTRSNKIRAIIRPLISERMRHAAFEWVIRDLEKSQMPAEIRAELTEYYRQDILQLQNLLQRDLSHWLEFTNSSGD
ncbi:MAG: sulfotransferase [Anaerolineales bacterium]|nr:sulfotransferase [Anaerolineales bacterium]